MTESSLPQSSPRRSLHELNSITRLRERERAYSRREFIARGSRSVRCEHCLLAETSCICSQRPAPVNGVAVCLLYYKGEVFKPSNTGRLIADVLADNHAYLWTRTEPEPELAALLSNNAYAPLLVFPKEYAALERQLNESSAINTYINGRIPLLIFLDGTWREARKMFRSAWLNEIPVISIDPAQASQYLLRVAAHEHQLGTAEVAVPVLESLGFTTAALALSEYFVLFRTHYLAGKPYHASED